MNSQVHHFVDNVYSVGKIFGTEEQKASRPRISRPRYDHCDNTEKQSQRLSLILPWLNQAMEYAPHAARNPDAFLKLAEAQGYPSITGSVRIVRQHAEELLRLWRNISPQTAKQADLWTGQSQSGFEHLSPGLMRRMRESIEEIRPTLGRAVLADRSILDDAFGFFRLCRKHGYSGPGAGHDLSAENDVNRKLGEKLISAFRLVILD